MGDNLVGDPACVAPCAGCIENYRAVESSHNQARSGLRSGADGSGARGWPRFEAAGRRGRRWLQFGFQLSLRNIGLDEQTGIVQDDVHWLPTPQASVPAGHLVVTLAIGEGIAPPSEQREPVPNRLKQHFGAAKPRQIE